MSIAEVRNLPLREKFQILEVIWDDLIARMDEMSVSPADRDLLDERNPKWNDSVLEPWMRGPIDLSSGAS